jgi:hypothetical protein
VSGGIHVSDNHAGEGVLIAPTGVKICGECCTHEPPDPPHQPEICTPEYECDRCTDVPPCVGFEKVRQRCTGKWLEPLEAYALAWDCTDLSYDTCCCDRDNSVFHWETTYRTIINGITVQPLTTIGGTITEDACDLWRQGYGWHPMSFTSLFPGAAGIGATLARYSDCYQFLAHMTWGNVIPDAPWNFTGSFIRFRRWLDNGGCATQSPCEIGACCCKGWCYELTVDECDAIDGDFKGRGTNCREIECPAGCCTNSGCEDMTFTECLASGGLPWGHPCDQLPPNVCLGACCRTNQHGWRYCEDGVTPSSCSGLGESFLGFGSRCWSAACPTYTGACCIQCSALSGGATGPMCEPNQTSLSCAQAGGIWQGPFTSCTPDPCPQPLGACCITDPPLFARHCRITTERCCGYMADPSNPHPVTWGGEWMGPGTTCDPDPCNPECNSCCVEDDDSDTLLCYNVANEAECAGLNGTYREGVGCPGTPCTNTSECVINPEDGSGGYSQSMAVTATVFAAPSSTGCTRCGSAAGGNEGILI